MQAVFRSFGAALSIAFLGSVLAQSAALAQADPAIAYQGTIKGKSGLAVCNADGTNEALIHSKGGQLYPSWSPDGARITFWYPFEIWRIDVGVVNGVPRGSNAVRLLGGDGYNYFSPKWSPTGDVILARRGSRGSPYGNVFLTVPATGGAPTILYEPPGGATGGAGIGSPTWSPDGSRIAFTEALAGSNDYRIVVLDLASGITATILSEEAYGFSIGRLEWARTRDALAFDDGSTGAVYAVDTAVGVPGVVTAGGWPSWSPDDSALAFHSGGAIKRINLSTGVVQTLKSKASYPDWRRF